MIEIGICDDDTVFRENLKIELEHYFSNTTHTFCLHLFGSSKDLLTYGANKLHLLFLDIRMPDQSGLEVASMIHSHPLTERPVLIFISSLSNYVFDAIHYAPFRFIRKELLQDELTEALTAFLKLYQQLPSELFHIEVVEKGTTFLINIQDIYYVETNGHYVDFHGLQKDYHIRGKLAEYEKLLQGHGFERIHQGCLVNLYHIQIPPSDSVTLKNGKTLFISRSCKASFRLAYMKWERSHTHVLTV